MNRPGAETERTKGRGPNLTDDRIAAILDIIDRWEGAKLTWSGIIESVKEKLGTEYTRQALSKHLRIQVAYETRKKIVARRGQDSIKSTGNIQLDEALRNISKLEAEIARLKQGERNFLEQFARWATNAAMEGIDPRKLNRPIERVNRDPSTPISNMQKRSLK